MNFLRLPKAVWNLTDEQFVERARKAQKWTKPLNRAVCLLWLAIVIGVFLTSLWMVDFALEHPAGPKGSLMAVAYVLGALAGGIMGYTLLKAVVLVAEAWGMARIYGIMLASWDRVKELEQANAIKGGNLTPPPAGSPPP